MKNVRVEQEGREWIAYVEGSILSKRNASTTGKIFVAFTSSFPSPREAGLLPMIHLGLTLLGTGIPPYPAVTLPQIEETYKRARDYLISVLGDPPEPGNHVIPDPVKRIDLTYKGQKFSSKTEVIEKILTSNNVISLLERAIYNQATKKQAYMEVILCILFAHGEGAEFPFGIDEKDLLSSLEELVSKEFERVKHIKVDPNKVFVD